MTQCVARLLLLMLCLTSADHCVQHRNRGGGGEGGSSFSRHGLHYTVYTFASTSTNFCKRFRYFPLTSANYSELPSDNKVIPCPCRFSNISCLVLSMYMSMSMSVFMSMFLLVHAPVHAACLCPCSRDMDMQHGLGHAA